MATNDLTNKYFIKNTLAGTYADFATLFDGLRILRIDGFLAQGQSKNVYTASWEYEDEEDFAIVMQDDSDAPRIIHESADINITFIIRQKYATGAIDVHTQHKKFIEYMTEKDVWIKNSYNNNLVAHCVCLKEYSPTTEKYQRGSDSWVMGTITLHKLTSKLYHEFALTTSLIGCTSDLPPVITNEKLFATIIPLAGHQQLPWNTKVTMGGFDITSSVYDKSTGTISISSVTGDVTVVAEAVMMSSEYEPVEYILKYSNHQYGILKTDFVATHLTEIVLDMEMVSAKTCVMIGHDGFTTTGNGSTTPDFHWRARTTSGSIYGAIKYNETYISGSAIMTPPLARMIVTFGRGIMSYKNDSVDWSRSIGSGEFKTARPLWFFGSDNTNNSGGYYGNIYSILHKEDDVVEHRFLPVRRKVDGYVGFYDSINSVGTIFPSSHWIAPNVITTRNYTNCSATLLSAAKTGTTARAVIGSTWSIKITPSSGYTFVGGTTPQVLIDGIDVTSQVVSDNGDGTYNVTIANVEDKPIEITAVAVSDGTANATNSVTPMGGNGENEEM